MFLNCPAHPAAEPTARCGLPAEIICQFTMQSSDGPLDSAMIRCPAGHWFNAPIEFLSWDSTGNHNRANTATAASARHAGPTGTFDGHAGTGRPIPHDPGTSRQQTRRPNTAPAYYLGRPASLWISVMSPRRKRTAPRQLTNGAQEAVAAAPATGAHRAGGPA